MLELFVNSLDFQSVDLDEDVELEPLPPGMLGPVRGVCPYRERRFSPLLNLP